MNTTSPQPLAGDLLEALALFEQGEWYGCHDRLEALWHQSLEPMQTPLHALLQIAVAMLHWEQGNSRGATLLWGEALARLRRCDDDFNGVDLSFLRAQAVDWLRFLRVGGTQCSPPPPRLDRPIHPQLGPESTDGLPA